jgi:hypothetical protein
MRLLLRKSSAQARIEGWDPRNRSDDDYAVVDDTIVGRIYREMILGNRSGGGSCNRSPRQVRGGQSAAKSRHGRYVGRGEGSVQKAL